jgi:hypothetical protein
MWKFCTKEERCFSRRETKHERSCIKKQKEINKIMAYKNVRFMEAGKIVEKWSQPWHRTLFSSGAESLQGYVEPNMSIFPILKMPR